MKIALLAGTLGQGGAEKQLYLLASELHQNGDEVCVYTMRTGDFWEAKLRKAGIQVVNIDHQVSRIKRLVALFHQIKAAKPDILYSFHFYTSTYAGIIGRLLGIFSIGSIRNDGNIEKKSNGKMAYFHFHLPHAIIANSQHGLSNSQNIFLWKRKRMALLANALPKLAQVPEISRSEATLRILFVGRLEPQKRPLLFLEIIKQAKAQSNIKIEAIILGDGRLKQEMLAYCETHQLLDVVTFKGKVPNVPEYMASANLLLCTSAFEGTPNVILEAMSMELPVVSANFAGIKELVGTERGFIFNNVDEATKAISNIHQQDVLPMTQSAKSFINKNYSIEGLVDRFYLVIKQFRK